MSHSPKAGTFESKKASAGQGHTESWRQGLGQLKEQSRLLWLVSEGVEAILTAQADGGLPADATAVTAKVTEWVQQSLTGPSALRFDLSGGVAVAPVVRPGGVSRMVRSKPAGTPGPVAPGRVLDTASSLAAVSCPVLWIGSGEIVGGNWTTAVLGVESNGEKRVLAVRSGSVREPKVAAAVLGDLKQRGLVGQSRFLVVTGGSRALDEALLKTWGSVVVISHCRHRLLEEVAAHLPEAQRETVCAAVVEAWKVPATATETLKRLVEQLEKSAPGAAERLNRSIDPTLAVDRLGVPTLLQGRLVSLGTLNQAFKQAWAWKSRSHGGLAALLSGLEIWLSRTRRLTGFEHLGALSQALASVTATTPVR